MNQKLGKWIALINLKGGKLKYGGSFTDELDAANRVNQLCQEFGIPIQNHGIETSTVTQFLLYYRFNYFITERVSLKFLNVKNYKFCQFGFKIINTKISQFFYASC